MDKEELKQLLKNNFNDSETKKEFSKIIDLAAHCLKHHEPMFSSFYDPVRLAAFTHSVFSVKGLPIDIKTYGGYESSERKIIGIFPDYHELTDQDFPISILKIVYNQKYSKTLKHSDYLGSIMGLQINRAFLGDIITNENGAYVFVKDSLAGFICSNLEKVGNANVTAEIVNEIDDFSENYIEKRITVSSIRLDSVIGSAFNMSRSKASDIIKAGKAFVNWELCEQPSKTLKENETVTIRGFGRVVIKEIAGSTKKDRIILVVRLKTR